MTKRLLSGTGGSTKGIGIYHAFKTLIQNGYEPDYILGVSVSSIIGVPVAMKKWRKLDEVFSKFDLKYIFNKSPVNKKGNVTLGAGLRAVFGCPSLGEMRNVTKVLAGIISESDYQEYQKGDYAEVYVGAVDFKSGKEVIKNLKDPSLSYNDFLAWVLASSSIPVFTEPVFIGDMILFDGGVRNHGITAWGMENLKPDISVSVYSRPRKYDVSDPDWEPKNVLEVLDRTIEIMNVEISKNDEAQEIAFAEKHGIESYRLFLPKILKSLYDVDRKRLNRLGAAGRIEAERILPFVSPQNS